MVVYMDPVGEHLQALPLPPADHPKRKRYEWFGTQLTTRISELMVRVAVAVILGRYSSTVGFFSGHTTPEKTVPGCIVLLILWWLRWTVKEFSQQVFMSPMAGDRGPALPIIRNIP